MENSARNGESPLSQGRRHNSRCKYAGHQLIMRFCTEKGQAASFLKGQEKRSRAGLVGRPRAKEDSYTKGHSQ
jgi:hypothetical protein